MFEIESIGVSLAQATRLHRPCDWDLSHRPIPGEGGSSRGYLDAAAHCTINNQIKKTHQIYVWCGSIPLVAFSAPRGSGQLRSAVTLQQPPSALPIGGSAYFQPPPSKSRHVAVKRYQDADETGFVTAYRCDHGNKGNNNLSPVFSRQSNHAGRDEDAASVPLPSPKPVNYSSI